MKPFLTWWALLAGIALLVPAGARTAVARSPARVVVGFGFSNDVGFGHSVYVVGSHPDLGSFQATNGVKLRFTTGNVWTGRVAVQAGTELTYRFLSRDDSIGQQCAPANGTVISADFTNHLPPEPEAPYRGKTIFYYSGWTNAVLGYSTNATDFVDAPMSLVSTGRNGQEFLYRVDRVGEAGEPIQFFLRGFSNDVLFFDNARFGGFGAFDNDYYTRLDAFVLQDGDLFTYWPPPSVSPSRVETNFVVSTEPDVMSRQIKVYLPRGYDENTWKAYPVVYMHDGNVVFTPDVSGLSGAGWEADKVADKEISQGRMREAIMVGVFNNPAERTREYLPPEDDAGGQGFGDRYGAFLIRDLKNGIVDVLYRTLTNREHTITIGSSSGGLIASYLGWSTNAFGKVGAMSPAYAISSNFVSKIDADPKQPLRMYTDISELGLDVNLYLDYQRVYDLFLDDGYAVNHDLLALTGCGHGHNEQAWHARLPHAFRFLLALGDEPNRLAQWSHPPRLVPEGAGAQRVDSLRGFAYRLERTTNILHVPWQAVNTSDVEGRPWATTTLVDTHPPLSASAVMYRAVAVPRP